MIKNFKDKVTVGGKMKSIIKTEKQKNADITFFGYILRYSIAFLAFPFISPLVALVAVFNFNAGFALIRQCCHFSLMVLKIEVIQENHNTEKDLQSGNCIYVQLNQESLLEGVVFPIVAPTPYRSIINIEFALIPFYGLAAAIAGWVIIRQWPKQAKRKLNKVASNLRGGGFVLISIEGKRSKDGSLSPYKKGPAVLAIQSGARIIPVITHGARDCLPYGEWRIRPGKITVKFLKAIPTKGMCYEDRDSLVRQLRELAEQEVYLQTKQNR